MRQALTVFVLVPILAGWSAEAGIAQPLSLAEAMAEARAGGKEVRAAQARYQASEAGVQQAKGFRLPRVSVSEVWSSTDSPAEAFALRLNQRRFSMADFMSADPNRPDRLTTGLSRVELSLPLYAGGELRARIEQAEAAAEAARLRGERTGDLAAFGAGEAYVRLVQAREFRILLEKSRDTVAAHAALAREYAGQGMVVASELLRAEVELARLEDMVLEATGRERVAEANLAFQLGRDQSAVVATANLPEVDGVETDLEWWLAAAVARRDVAAADAMIRAAKLEESALRGAMRPRVGLVARGELVDDRPFGSRGESTTVMAVASLDLYTGGSHRAAVAAARWQAEAGRIEVERMKEGIGLEVREAHATVIAAQARAATARRAVAAARENERIVTERFRAGVVKMLDVLDASTTAREAETRELVARADALASRLRLALAAGIPPETALP